MCRLFLILITLLSPLVHAKLLDKIVLNFDGQPITLSLMDRVVSTFNSRSEISPQIYEQGSKTFDLNMAINLEIQTRVIRKELASQNIIITDEQTELQIQSTEKRLGLNREALISFLDSRGLSFDEYFEITRTTIEFNTFFARVISPLVSITDQELKNDFFNKHSSDSVLSFKYTLIDYSVQPPIDQVEIEKFKEEFQEAIKKQVTSGILPEKFKAITISTLDNISQEGISSELSTLLKNTDEGAYSKPIFINQELHIFFVSKKDIVESDLFIKEKEKIRARILEERSKQVFQMWLKREAQNFYIKTFL